MAILQLGALDEVISARRNLHGGNVGAPILLGDGSRQGAALNRACVNLLSSSLQGYVEEVFWHCSEDAFGEFDATEERNYRATWNRWGNPNPQNIIQLFRRLGVDDVLDELSWQGQSTKSLKNNLDTLNQVRNCVAHGAEIKVNGKAFSLTLNRIYSWRRVVESFGNRFEAHARAYFEEEE